MNIIVKVIMIIDSVIMENEKINYKKNLKIKEYYYKLNILNNYISNNDNEYEHKNNEEKVNFKINYSFI